MTLMQILDAVGLAVLLLQAGWLILLHRRLGRLRDTLAAAPDVVAQIDQAAQQLASSSGGMVGRVKEGLGELDGRLRSARILMQEMTAATRQAEQAAGRLELLMRTSRRQGAVRATVPQREEVEPLGFAELLQARSEASARPAEAHEELAQRILAAEMPLTEPGRPGAGRATPRRGEGQGTLDTGV